MTRLTLGIAIGIVALTLLAIGCESPSPGPSARGPVTRTPDGSPGLAEAIDAALADAARHIQATRPATADNPATVNLIELASLDNQTTASERDFGRFAEDLQIALRRLSTRHGLVMAEGGATGLSAYQLHIAVLQVDDGDGMWLARMQLVGRRGTGDYGLIWSDAALVPAP